MTVSRDAVSALCFLALSLAYGWQAASIGMFPGQEFEPFTPRTFPYALAAIGALLSLAQLVKSLRAEPEAAASWAGFDWLRVGLLILSMLVYGALFTPLGFLLSTMLFLAAGTLILGERRILVILGASVGVSAVFWAIMTQLLGLYLAPGDLFRGWLV